MNRYTLLHNRRALLPGRGENQHEHPGLAFETMAPVLGLYFRALAGRNVALLPYGNDQDPKQYPDTQTTIRLPSRIDKFPANDDNFDWYKIALTHRAAHYEGGSFDFSFWKPAAHFARLRPEGLDELPRHEFESDLESFFRLFAEPTLAIEIFTVLEDLRLDEWSKRRYPGLRAAFEIVQKSALVERPALTELPPRTALTEVMLRFSLNATEALNLPVLLHDPVRHLTQLMAPLRLADATVEDSAEATLRVYSLITRLPNLQADYGEPAPVDLSQQPTPVAWPTAWPEPAKTRLEGDEALEVALQPVSYRDRLGSRYTFYRGAGPLDQQTIYRFTHAENADGSTGTMAKTLDDNRDAPPGGPPQPLPHDHHDHFGEDPQHHAQGELHSHELSWHIYPEWDHVAGRYRRNWCCVRETRLDAAASARFYAETLQAYGALVPEIRRQFERLAHEGLRKLRRTLYGDELDLDAGIEAMVDLKLGITPSDHVYVAREPVARDVALALLLDMSASTADHVEPQESAGLRAASAQRLHGKSYRTILDIEKESVALLMAALERLGDRYGIYCFSGSGREDVRFMVLKDLHERLSDRVAARLENIKPVHTTRMGAAIRHAVRKLQAQEAKTKILILVSDGRPFDLDYGQEYGENAEVNYAVHDTRQALQEAQQRGVTPFILTVDHDGSDYLRVMCDDLQYEVLNDVNLLPARLLALYRRLTS